METGLPQRSVVEETLNENHFRIPPDLVPRVQATFGARQKAVRRRGSRQASAIEVAFQREDDAMNVGIVAGSSDQRERCLAGAVSCREAAQVRRARRPRYVILKPFQCESTP